MQIASCSFKERNKHKNYCCTTFVVLEKQITFCYKFPLKSAAI